MIPKYAQNSDANYVQYKTKTYRIDFENKRIIGFVDGLDAMTQAVKKAFLTERYSEQIYSGDYGIELQRLVGESTSFVEANIQTTLEEALQTDGRINEVNDVNLNINLDVVTASCTIKTTLGEADVSIEISRA